MRKIESTICSKIEQEVSFFKKNGRYNKAYYNLSKRDLIEWTQHQLNVRLWGSPLFVINPEENKVKLSHCCYSTLTTGSRLKACVNWLLNYYDGRLYHEGHKIKDIKVKTGYLYVDYHDNIKSKILESHEKLSLEIQ